MVRPQHDLSADYQPVLPDFLQADPSKHKYPAQFIAFKTQYMRAKKNLELNLLKENARCEVVNRITMIDPTERDETKERYVEVMSKAAKLIEHENYQKLKELERKRTIGVPEMKLFEKR